MVALACGASAGTGASGCGSDDDAAPVDAGGPDAELGGLRVEGQIVSATYRLPLPYALAWVDGRVVQADAQGRFTVDGVTPPYDAAAVSLGGKMATIYFGLTRSDPVLELLDLPAYSETTIGGILGGGAGYPQPIDHETSVTFVGASGMGSHLLGGNQGPEYLIIPRWHGVPSLPGSVCAVQRQLVSSDSLVVAYAEAPVTVTAVNPQTVDLSLAPVGSSTLAGEVLLPPGWATADAVIAAEGSCRIGNYHASAGATFSLASPVVEGRTVRIQIYAHDAEMQATGVAWASGLAPDTTGVVMAVPEPSELVQPAEFTPLRGTFFEWSGGPDGLQMSVFTSLATEGKLTVLTADRFFRMPDLSETGFAFLSTVAWQVTQAVGYRTTDEAAAPDGGGAVDTYSIETRAPTGAHSFSRPRTVSP